VPLDHAPEALPVHLVDAEGRQHLAQDLVRRQVTVLELFEVRHDLGGDELAHCIADHELLLGPFDHEDSFSTVTPEW
jgi:hypothetical protein